MRFKSVLTASACAIALALPVAAHAQFGGLLGGGASKGASADVGAEVKKFMTAANDASTLTGNSLAQMLAAISSTEQSTALAAATKAANDVTDPQEKEAKLRAIAADNVTKLKEQANEKNKDKLAALDAESKSKLSKSFFNYVLGVLRAKDVIPQGQNVIKSVASNPMEIGKVASVKDALPHLQSIVTDSGSLMSSIPALFKQANIAVTIPSGANVKPSDGVI